jgi:hypothetical protein
MRREHYEDALIPNGAEEWNEAGVLEHGTGARIGEHLLLNPIATPVARIHETVEGGSRCRRRYCTTSVT